MPAQAQDVAPADPYADTVYSGDYLSIGFGAGVSPSYAGSDDYVITPMPIVQGSLGGVDINPRAAGLALDFIPDPDNGVGFDFGITARLRSDRAMQIADPVVKSLGKLDRAIEVGPTAGISFPAVFNPYDSLTVTTDLRWDVAGAHGGMVVDPSIAYFTPLSEAIAASLTLGAEYGDGDFRDYYYAVSPAQNVATLGELPVFSPAGGGFNKAGATLLLGFDLNGDLTDGGWGIVTIAGYSRMLGGAKRSPFTSVRGSANQFFGALGVGYTF
ncbi:MipA/OmpV family protein [Altererythrobacter aestuarii]|uniref:MipA/OmpV family protein n=2 Tax=Alteraurantiacibacter aestuarii TaxID=650004 RepID=A0A844ZJ89_9SPHN|nr:MipA/OmpV family protein [Alteraurantiacibacter aestuarii]